MKRPFGISPLLLILLGIVIILGGLGYFYMYKVQPLAAKTAGIQAQTQQVTAQIQTKQLEIKQAQSINVDTLLVHLPNNPDTDQYVMLLDDYALAQHCTLVSIKATNGAASPIQGLQSVTYDVSATTQNFSSMVNMLHAVETLSRRYSTINGLHFTGSKKGGVTFNLNVSVFYNPALKDLGPSNLNLPYVPSANQTSPF